MAPLPPPPASYTSVSGTYRVDLAIEEQRDAVCKLFVLLCYVFLGAAPISYGQAAILNLPHP